jgi:hypothetical protein
MLLRNFLPMNEALIIRPWDHCQSAAMPEKIDLKDQCGVTGSQL